MAKEPLAANIKKDFTLGYRNREDVSTLRPDIMVTGSKNVLTNTYKRIGSRNGYSLDGQRGTANSGIGIVGSFDWYTHLGFERNLRATSDGTVQYRYVAAAGDKYAGNTFVAGQIYWINLRTSGGSLFNACRFWDFTDELKDLMLWVDGTSNIFMWSGALATLSATSWATGSVSVLNATPTAGGAGYVIGDVLTITTGGTGATLRVDNVTGGVVTSVSMITPGSGYTTGAGKATSGGTGVGATVNITTVAQGFIKINGTTTPPALGFMSSGAYTQSVSLNDNSYTYSTTFGFYLVGLSADPTAEPVNSVIQQTPVTTANSAITGVPAVFTNALIENLNNQIYLSATNNNSVYVSKVNTFKDYSFDSPRKVGQGAILTLDGVPTCLQQQSDSMFISAGRNYWYLTKFTIGADGLVENLTIAPIKTTVNQACQADGLSAKVKNLIAFVSFETQINTLGIEANYFGDAQVTDLSYSIVHDVQNRDFTGGHVLYFQKFLFVTSPSTGTVFIYNMTQNTTEGIPDVQGTHYWEAPQTIPVGRLAIIDGELYGHTYNETNSFKLFTGLSDDGKPYKCVALFAYDPHGDRTTTKSSNELFIEGYKDQGTVLTAYLRRDINGPVSSWKWQALPAANLTPVIDDASIGKISIGKVPIGGTLQEVITNPIFRLIQTFPKTPYWEEQVGFSSEGTGQNWELLSSSTNATETTENQASIYDPPQSPI